MITLYFPFPSSLPLPTLVSQVILSLVTPGTFGTTPRTRTRTSAFLSLSRRYVCLSVQTEGPNYKTSNLILRCGPPERLVSVSGNPRIRR